VEKKSSWLNYWKFANYPFGLLWFLPWAFTNAVLNIYRWFKKVSFAKSMLGGFPNETVGHISVV